MLPTCIGVEYWTLLFLLPHHKRRGPHIYRDMEEFGRCKWLMMAMLVGISWSLEWASRSWVIVADRLEELLHPVDAEELPVDDDYSQSHSCFWIISNIEEFEPMILDAIEQWTSFSTKYKLHNEMQDFPLEQLEMPDIDSPHKEAKREGQERRREEMLERMHEINTHKKRLNDSLRRLQALRKKAKTIRDGVGTPHATFFYGTNSLQFCSLGSVIEAKQSRVLGEQSILLGENVKLLTYVTIFYLPLAFSSVSSFYPAIGFVFLTNHSHCGLSITCSGQAHWVLL